MVSLMDARIRGGAASGPAEWLLAFLRAREKTRRARTGRAAGPAEWLLVFLEAERTETAARQRPSVLSRRGKTEEYAFGRLNARTA
ncbi:hypothetical protein Arub01_02570 [Actinomadura rubrobrunea]|uniref:Uncharacterized protein n=2 Tax=Actinomadura rubrobrunea TaxID=115335 RepID=A0A9W6UTQ0_9ACTN|nr:hypothetical protein Arub01_02570 [Actinomadura rubrobrunea]